MKAIQSLYLASFMAVAMLTSCLSFAANNASLDQEIEALKADVIELNQSLYELEEKLLFPATTSFAVFVSMEAVKNFEISGVKLNLDEEPVTAHIYSREQIDALRRGGIQKLYTANLKPGLHKLTAVIDGKDEDGRPVQKTVVADFGKARSTKYLEIKISQNKKKQRPEFAIVEWK